MVSKLIRINNNLRVESLKWLDLPFRWTKTSTPDLYVHWTFAMKYIFLLLFYIKLVCVEAQESPKLSPSFSVFNTFFFSNMLSVVKGNKWTGRILRNLLGFCLSSLVALSLGVSGISVSRLISRCPGEVISSGLSHPQDPRTAHRPSERQDIGL